MLEQAIDENTMNTIPCASLKYIHLLALRAPLSFFEAKIYLIFSQILYKFNHLSIFE